MERKALGKGLDALIRPSSSVSKDLIVELEIDKIRLNPYQPRKALNKEELMELAESIKANGLIQPVVARKEGNYYYLIAGERRLKAARLAGLTKIPAIIKQSTAKKSLIIALVENIQRRDLNPIEEAAAYSELINDLSLTQEQVAKSVGKSRVYITNKLRLLKLPDYVKQMIVENKISEGQARAMINLKQNEIKKIIKAIENQNLSVREVEKLAQRKKTSARIKQILDPNLINILENMESIFATKVDLKYKKGKGKIEIYFFNDDDLNRIYEIITKNK